VALILPVRIDRTPGKSGKARPPFTIELWDSPEGWRWKVPGGSARFSDPYPTREAATDAACSRDGLGPP
jgi:hypothetical protein